MTFPSEARRSFVRTNAPPLPGLTCWNSRTLKTVPSTSMWLPFLSWLVLIDTLTPYDERGQHDERGAEAGGRLYPREPQDGPRGRGLHQPQGAARGDRAVGRLQGGHHR